MCALFQVRPRAARLSSQSWRTSASSGRVWTVASVISRMAPTCARVPTASVENTATVSRRHLGFYNTIFLVHDAILKACKMSMLQCIHVLWDLWNCDACICTCMWTTLAWSCVFLVDDNAACPCGYSGENCDGEYFLAQTQTSQLCDFHKVHLHFNL